jgi:hypothetical protein
MEAQAVFGSIVGTATDSTGAVIPNATIVVTDVSKGTSQTVQSNGDGNYSVLRLIPDTYTIKATATGFAPAEADNVVVSADSAPQVNLVFQAAGGDTSITVTSAPPALQTDSAPPSAQPSPSASSRTCPTRTATSPRSPCSPPACSALLSTSRQRKTRRAHRPSRSTEPTTARSATCSTAPTTASRSTASSSSIPRSTLSVSRASILRTSPPSRRRHRRIRLRADPLRLQCLARRRLLLPPQRCPRSA